MRLLTPYEFEQMEQLLAQLLSECADEEEAQLLMLHRRLADIFAQQSALNASRSRLTALQLRTLQ